MCLGMYVGIGIIEQSIAPQNTNSRNLIRDDHIIPIANMRNSSIVYKLTLPFT